MVSNKFGAKRTFSALCQREFASIAEAVRGEELALLEKGRQISDLEYQPRFVLSKDPQVTYTADFRYREMIEVTAVGDSEKKYAPGASVVEDVKGVLTDATRVRLAWLKQLTGIEVKIV